MSSGRVVASLAMTVGSFLFSAMIAVVMGIVTGAEAEITAVSPVLWQLVSPLSLLVLMGGIALVLWALTILSWWSGVVRLQQS